MLHVLMVAWLAISSGESAEVDPHVAPAVPAWPQGLPDAVETADGVLLPHVLADATHQRLLYLDTFPARCQANLDQLEVLHAIERQTAVDLALAEQASTAAAEPWWQRFVLPFGLGTGFVVGFVLHSLLTR